MDCQNLINSDAQKASALELVQALVFRQDERVADLCSPTSPATYSAFLSPSKLPSLDDLADSPSMKMKQFLRADEVKAGWAPISKTTLEDLLDSRLRAFGTSTMCSEQIMGIMCREDVCAIRFREINRTGAVDKTSTLRLHFTGEKIDAIDEFVDSRRSFGYERAVAADTTMGTCVAM